LRKFTRCANGIFTARTFLKVKTIFVIILWNVEQLFLTALKSPNYPSLFSLWFSTPFAEIKNHIDARSYFVFSKSISIPF
jgi:hypothetical protein